jgi:hypothetical protein
MMFFLFSATKANGIPTKTPVISMNQKPAKQCNKPNPAEVIRILVAIEQWGVSCLMA